MKYYWTIRRNEILIHVTTWMNLESITLSERSQLQRTRECVSPFTWNAQIGKSHADRNWIRDYLRACEAKGDWQWWGFFLEEWKCSLIVMMNTHFVNAVRGTELYSLNRFAGLLLIREDGHALFSLGVYLCLISVLNKQPFLCVLSQNK